MKNLSQICLFTCCFFGVFELIHAQTITLLPNIPNFSTNPYKTSMWKGLDTTNPAVVLDFNDATELQLASFAYFHPQSPHYLQPKALTRYLSLLDSTLTAWNKNKNLADITNCFEGCFAYNMLRKLNPALIPASRKAIWESGVRKQIDSCYKSALTVFKNHYVRDVWLNGHQRIALAMFFGGDALGDSIYKEYGRYATEEIFPQCLLKDGGTHYLSYHNEAVTYHPLVVKYFLDYWLATGSSTILNVLKKLKNYAPLSQHAYKNSKGFCEYSTGPSNKCYYNGLVQDYSAAVSGFISKDGYNYSIGKNTTGLELGFIYTPGVVAKTLPNNFMVYDSNILGPRGVYDFWGVVGTTRDPSSALPDNPDQMRYGIPPGCEGKNTFVGAYVLDTVIKNWKNNYPLNAAFHAVAPGVKINKGDELEWGRGNKNSWLTVNEKNAITKSQELYGISTRYTMNKAGGRFDSIPWEGIQQWVITKNRLIGMLEIQALKQQNVYGLKNRFLFVSGRKGVSGTKKLLNIIDRNTYQYGMLTLKIHDENYKGIIDTQYVNIINFATNDDFSAEIELHDQLDSAKDKLITYKAGTKRFALVEITNTTKNFSNTSTYPLTNPSLTGFQFTEQSGRKVRMVHNFSNQPISYTDTMYCPSGLSRILKSWDSSTNIIPINNKFISFSMMIPPNQHIMVINSPIQNDFKPGFNTYNDIFSNGSTLPIVNVNFSLSTNNCVQLFSWDCKDKTSIRNFELEQSIGNEVFTSIQNFTTTTNVSNKYTYSLSNQPPAKYRLKTIYADGEISYSDIISVKESCPFISDIQIYPNPVKGGKLSVSVISENDIANAKWQIFTVKGQCIQQKKMGLKKGKNIFDISTVTFSNGDYFLKMICPETTLKMVQFTVGK